MAWQMMAAQAAVGAIGNTLSAISNQQVNRAKESLLDIQLNAFLISANEEMARSQASWAVKGNMAGTTIGVNKDRQRTVSQLAQSSLQRDTLRRQSQAGFFNAALGTGIQIAATGLDYSEEQSELAKTQKLEAAASKSKATSTTALSGVP